MRGNVSCFGAKATEKRGQSFPDSECSLPIVAGPIATDNSERTHFVLHEKNPVLSANEQVTVPELLDERGLPCA